MIKILLLLTISSLLLIHPASGQTTADDATKGCRIEGNRIICMDGQITSLNDVLLSRIPRYSLSAPSSQVPAVCHKSGEQKMQELVNQYRSQDSVNLRQLANNYCSHISGWVEFVPGTCQAGGPPPLCPAKHWHWVGQLEGLRQWNNEQQQLRESREKELRSRQREADQAVCDCWLGELQKHDESLFKPAAVPHPADKNQSVNITTFNHMPCLGGCPPGYKCENGFCVPEEKTAEVSTSPNKIKKTIGADNYYKLQNSPEDLAKDKVADYGKERLLKMFSEGRSYLAFMEKHKNLNATFFAIEHAYPVTPLNDNYGAYMNKLSQLNDDINNLETLYDQAVRYKQGRNLTRDIAAIQADIARTKETINKDLLILNEDRSGILIENKNSGACCAGVLNYYNDKVFEYANHVLNISIE